MYGPRPQWGLEATENGKFCLACRGLPDWGGLGWGRQAKVDSTDAQDCGRGACQCWGILSSLYMGEANQGRKEKGRQEQKGK